MNTVVNRYRYTISDRLGALIVQPLGESEFTIEWDADTDGKQDYNQTLPNAIVFRGDAYKKLLKIETSIYRCEYTAVTIERKCGNDSWVPWFSGRVSNNDGTWDLEKCEVSIKMDDVKPEQCIEDNQGTKVNLFGLVNLTQRRTVLLSGGDVTLEFKHFTTSATGESGCANMSNWGDPGAPGDGNWIEYKEVRNESGSGTSKTCSLESWWARETVALPCGSPSPGTEWKVVADACPTGNTTYARQARLYSCVYTPPDYNASTQETSFECKIIGDSADAVSIDNGMPMDLVFEGLVNDACPGVTVVSNFFQINPDIPSSINYVTGLRTKTAFITMFQKSDMKRPTASDNATIAEMTLENFLAALVAMFNVRWRLDGNVFRIEHVSYYTRANGLNLTLSKWDPYMVGSRKYSYDTGTIPAQEQFKFMEGSTGDFAGVPIVYTGCVVATGRDSIKTYAAENVTTDVELALSNPDSDSDIVSDQGFMFVACDYDSTHMDYFIITESPILGGNSVNNSLGWAQLQRDYYKYDRPLRKGNMNQQDTTFFTVHPSKRGAEIIIPLCCGDTFNPDDLVTTPLGVGIVDKATFSFKKENLSLQLLYVADDNLVNNDPPVANNDSVATPENTSILIDVLGNDTDEKNMLLVLEIRLPALHGTAVVEGLKIRYTPNTGYEGQDIFLYRVYDEWNEPSNDAAVSVVVTAPNAPPVANPDSYIATKNTALNVDAFNGVLHNDSDDSGSFTLSSYDHTSTHGGTIAMASDGSFTYTPASGFVGTDTFTYTIMDGGGLTDTATVTITVRDPNVPVANTDNYQTVKNTNLSVAAPGVLSNDTTPSGTLTAVAATLTGSNGGTLTLAANGSFTYVPVSNFSGVDVFTYQNTNGTATGSGTINVRVLPNIYAHIAEVNPATQTQHISCSNGNTDGGQIQTATIRISYYSNSGGTVPFDVTGLGLVVNVRLGSQTTSGGAVSNTDSTYTGSGQTQDIFTNRTVARNLKDCNGATTSYLNESFTLLPGAYTVI